MDVEYVRRRMITRPAISCLPCRARKVKCERQTRCGHCQRRGEECVWPSSSNGTQRGIGEQTSQTLPTTRESTEQIVGIEARLAELEHLITDLREQKQKDGKGGTAKSNTHHIYSDFSSPSREIGDVAQLRPDDIVDLDEFDHQIISTLRKRVRRYSPVRATLQESPSSIMNSPDIHRPHILIARDETVHQFDDAQRLMNKTFSKLFRKVPGQMECDALLNRYWLRVEWIHHIIHRPTFEKWLNRIRIHFDQPFHIIQQSSQAFDFQDVHTLALLFSMLCLSLHFAHDCSKEDHWQAQRFYDLSHKALEQGDYLDNHSIATIQTLVMQGIWLNDHGKSDRHHVNLAMAIRIANLMGMPRQDIGKVTMDTTGGGRIPKLVNNFGSLHYDSIQETSRRIYWSLICQDCYTSSSCNFTYMIQPAQVYIAEPANLADVALKTSQTNSPPSLDERQTEMSYHIAKIPFAILTRQTIDLFGRSTLEIHFDDVIQLECLIFEAYDKLPSYLQIQLKDIQEAHEPEQDSFATQLLWQRIFLKVGIHYRIMRIYRPFVIRGYHEVAYKHATDTALLAASALLDLIQSSLQFHFPGVRWWVVRIQIFTAGVLFCVALHQQQQSVRNDEQAFTFSLNELQSYARLALQLLNNGVANSPAAQRAVSVLEALIRQATGEKEDVEDDSNRSNAENVSDVQLYIHAEMGQEQHYGNLSLPPPPPIEEAHSLIPTIDWAALIGETIGDARETLNDSRALAEVINAFRPNSWQL